jgi:phytoene/squalene synthetase
MKVIYFRLLQKIETNRFQVLDDIIRLSTPTKLWLTMSTAWQIQFSGIRPAAAGIAK